jgi:KDO2-lipid IV(A) lauroyltransferase
VSDSEQHPQQSLFHPRFWLTWAGVAILWMLAKLPFPAQLWFGTLLGRLFLAVSKRRRHIASVNLHLCFPELDEAEQEKLLKKHATSIGMSLIEIGMGWWIPEKRLAKLSEIDGLEHLQKALASGKGVILLSAHFTCLEVGGRLLAQHVPFHVMYRSNENPVVEHFMQRNRQTHFEKAIPRDDVRGMLKSLKEGKAVWYAPDQNFGHKNSIFAPFFGVPAATNTATARLARLSGAVVVPFFPKRKEDGSGYQLTLLPPLEDFPSSDIEQDTIRINQLIEQQVRRAPDQYLWMHRRFKDRPEGLEPVY